MTTSPNLLKEFETSGFAVIKNFLSSSEVNSLMLECFKIVEQMNLPDHCSVFQTAQNQDRDDYFMDSGDKIRFFFEKDAVDENALHWLNPIYKNVTFSNKVKNVFKELGYNIPVVVQSMFIFKHPGIGGVVSSHQDSTFLYTDPPSAVGIWLPLVDVTKDNGCLWFIPGSHKKEIYQRYIRNPGGKPQLVLKGNMPAFDEKDYVPVLVHKGDCVVIHGSVIHKSGKNKTNESRPVYTFHVVEQKDTEYSEENWLQPTQSFPFPALYSI